VSAQINVFQAQGWHTGPAAELVPTGFSLCNMRTLVFFVLCVLGTWAIFGTVVAAAAAAAANSLNRQVLHVDLKLVDVQYRPV
jgi:hypothetical protein